MTNSLDQRLTALPSEDIISILTTLSDKVDQLVEDRNRGLLARVFGKRNGEAKAAPGPH